MKNIRIRCDLGKIIKNFTYDGCNFHIEYYDGTSSDYICSDPQHAQKIKDLMYNQAMERQIDLSACDFNINENCMILAQLFNTFGFGYGAFKESSFLLVLFGILTGINVIELIKNAAARREFEKYLIFFELFEDKEIVNNSKFMECIEYDHLYQKRLDIDTVDEFTLGELRTLKRKLNEIKNRN